MKVGTKELKNRLSYYLGLVREGEHVQVTDRGAVVAEIRAARAAASRDEACLQTLEQEGLATRGRKQISDFQPLVARGNKKKLLSAIVIEDRE